MLALISERERCFNSDLFQESVDEVTKRVEDTPYGDVIYYQGSYEGKEFLYFTNGGANFSTDLVNAPLAIFHILKERGIAKAVLIAKVGGINTLLNVGDVVIPDDYIDCTIHKKRSFIQQENPSLSTIYTMETPFCPQLKESLLNVADEVRSKYPQVLKNLFNRGRYLCTEGPGFESASEISMFRNWGADIVAHTLVPHVYYARELGICLNTICIVSNVCLGYGEVGGEAPMLNSQEVTDAFTELFLASIKHVDPETNCQCNSDHFHLQKPTALPRG